MYPFGYGLTYSSFEYSDFKVDACYGGYQATFTLRNTGKITASEVAQIYVSAISPSLPRAGRELKGFKKVTLKPGESQQISIFLDRNAFSYYDTRKHDFVTESGEYRIYVSSDATTDKGECIVKVK